MEELYGYIERITFQSEENGFTVAKLKSPKKAELIIIVGNIPSVQPGETVRLKGHWHNDPNYGYQFQIKDFRTEAPADILGIKKYLGSGLIKGIGPAFAGRIVKMFGVDTLNIIDTEVNKLLEVAGIGKKRVERISECWTEQKSIREVMIFLQKYGVTPTYAQKIFKTYGDESIEKIQNNPFNLARDIFGIGFKTADSIAENMGIEKTSVKRIDAGVEHVLSELSNEGNTCYPVDKFLEVSQKLLETESSLINARLETLTTDKRIIIAPIVVEDKPMACVWLQTFHICEKGIAKELKRLKQAEGGIRRINTEHALKWVQEKLRLTLAENQKEAVVRSLEAKLHIITGGPGTGKSTITSAILTILQPLTENILLVAPTGRAAKRMSQITGMKAKTIHSVLEFDFKHGGFKRNRENPLEADLIIIDEASMIDTVLMYSLLKAISDSAKVIFVGDINQLPSVGAGNVLKDFIDSGLIPVTQLTEIFRQAAGSRIIINAHRINKGIFPEINTEAKSDFFFLVEDDPEMVSQTILDLVSHRIPNKYNFSSVDDIQVLSPMKRGIIGVDNMNTILQEKLNPSQNPLFRMGRRFHVNDKVMQIKNDYDKEVFNGDIGQIINIDNIEQEVIVRIDEKDVVYSFTEIDQLVLAYAVSIHKSQGSEYPCIILPVHTTHYKLLNRNLLYTGVTRGKKLVIVVGSKKALYIAVKNDEIKQRYTGLRLKLSG